MPRRRRRHSHEASERPAGDPRTAPESTSAPGRSAAAQPPPRQNQAERRGRQNGRGQSVAPDPQPPQQHLPPNLPRSERRAQGGRSERGERELAQTGRGPRDRNNAPRVPETRPQPATAGRAKGNTDPPPALMSPSTGGGSSRRRRRHGRSQQQAAPPEAQTPARAPEVASAAPSTRPGDAQRRSQQPATPQKAAPAPPAAGQRRGALGAPQPDTGGVPAVTIRLVGGDALEVHLPSGPIRRELSEQITELARHLGIEFTPRKLSPGERPRPPEKRQQP